MKKADIKRLIIPPQKWTKIKYKKPYILNLKNRNQEILSFGSLHSNNPQNKQFYKIENLFNQFISNKKKESLVILGEGIIPKETLKKEEMIRKYKEIGILTYLAKANKIKIISVEPSFKDLTGEVVKEKFKKKDIILWLAVNILWGRQKNNLRISDLKEIAQNLSLIDKNLNLNVFRKKEDIVDFLIKEFKKETGADILNIKISDFKKYQSPFVGKTIINKVSAYVNFSRDFLMVKKTLKELKNKKNVFTVLGHNHVVAQEPAIKYFFNKKGPIA